MIAGFINKPKGQSILQYTQDNFAYCVQNVLKNICGRCRQSVCFFNTRFA
jgi:hypothetical protein